MSTRFKSPFAFLGRSAAAEDDDKDDMNKSKSKVEDKDDDEDDDKKKDKKDDDTKSKSRAESDGDDKKDNDKDDKDDDKSKSKKAKSEASDDDDDKGTDAKAVRARERSRIRAILTSPAGQADPVAAAHVALDTGMPRADAIAMLTAMQLSRDAMAPVGAGASRDGLGTRMGAVPNPDVGADGGKSGGPSMADRIIAAGKKARGEA